MKKQWNPSSWRSMPIKQQPLYNDLKELQNIEKRLNCLPPVVSFCEVDRLKKSLALVTNGKAFVLQGGDCAEAFSQLDEISLTNYFRLFLQMNAVLMSSMLKPIVKIGRVAGQFAKPRSSDFENVDGVEYPSYRGDIINDIEANLDARIALPQRMVDAYFHSVAARNFLQNLASSPFSSLKNIASWFDKINDGEGKFQHIIQKVIDHCSFLDTCNVSGQNIEILDRADFYTSHEALLLNYEEGLLRQNKHTGKWYCLSASQLWIGDRTRNKDEAHVEFLSGIENPIGIKVGKTTNIDDLLFILQKLNPQNEDGKIILISRMGAFEIEKFLPQIVEKVKISGLKVIWQCDPMHGNTVKSESGFKTRKFHDIFAEISAFFDIHSSCGTYAGGIHLEMTGNDVTECIGGSSNVLDCDLKNRYHTHCDPRLNCSQSLEIALLIADKIKK